MKRATIKVEVDESFRSVSRAALLTALVNAAPQIRNAIAQNLPDAYDVSRKVQVAFAVDDD